MDAEYDDRMQQSINSDSDNSEVSAAPVDNIFPISSYSSLRFNLKDRYVYVDKDGLVAVANLNSTYFSISTPIKRTGELEVQLEGSDHGSGDLDLSLFEILLKREKSRDNHTNFTYRSCTITQEAVLNCLKTPASIQKIHKTFLLNNRLGIKITRSGDLEFFIDGKSQGIVAEAVYKLGHDIISYYPVVRVPYRYRRIAVRITAGGKSILFPFQGMPKCPE
jgi:hypothetical protein